MNPLFPLYEYVPDAEPHVFNDRLYLYGSHDLESGERFCMLDYVVYSADVKNLSTFKYEGVSYKKSQDIRSVDGKLVDYYAPDCVKGNDGKYYLYYCAMGPNVKPFGPMSVAVSDKPEGPFTYLSDIKNKDGSPLLTYLTNDPAVINDNGHIYLYYGWGLARDFRNKLLKPLYSFVQSKLFKRSIKEINHTKPSILSCAFIELEDDMFTIKSKPTSVLDSKTTADKRTDLYKHAFYEAPSIRKINDTYYLIYSSGVNGELCYATSKYPNSNFVYRGVIISNSDIGYKNNKYPKAFAGTIHGSIEYVNGEYYVFYHRLTQNSNFSRQACAEKIKILDDGSIPQVEITTQGITGVMDAKGEYLAALACNYFKRNALKLNKNNVCVTCKDDIRFVTNMSNHSIIGFKYFNINNIQSLKVKYRGNGGTLKLFTDYTQKEIDSILLINSNDFKEATFNIQDIKGTNALYFEYLGKGKIDLLSIEFI